jgi:integrase/recombinase XerD
MNNRGALGAWIRRFLMEYLVGERNLPRNTQQSYRDADRLLVTFVAAKTRKKVDELLVLDVDADKLRAFRWHIEEMRKCCLSSRSQHLAPIHALAGFIAERCAEDLGWCPQLGIVKVKRSAPKPVCYLEKAEIDVLLDAPNLVTKLGSRDRALLFRLYNSGRGAK